MTYSDCWIDTVDDENFRTAIANPPEMPADRLNEIPPMKPYWINIVRHWARKKGLPIDSSETLVVKVKVTRLQILEFLDEIFWKEEEAELRERQETLKHIRKVERIERLRAHTKQHLCDDRTYLIMADEF